MRLLLKDAAVTLQYNKLTKTLFTHKYILKGKYKTDLQTLLKPE